MTKSNDTNRQANKAGQNSPQKDQQTSGDREESMGQSGKDAFGKQNPGDSGTTSIAGDNATSNDKPGPGGVEGTGGTN